MKNLLLVALLLLTLPFWLPKALGGDISWHFVMTGSMKGSVDPGSFVVIRQSDQYQIGDVVSFRRKLGDGPGETLTVLHRIVGRLPDGGYVTKGDAVTAQEEVEPEAIKGRMVMAVPMVGFVPAAFRRAPVLLLGLLLASVFLTGSSEKAQASRAPSTKALFWIAATVLVLSFPYASIGLAAMLGKTVAFGLLVGVLGLTRLVESQGLEQKLLPLIEIGYMLVVVMSITSVSLPNVIQSVITGAGMLL
ncbi:MAG: hypothetical protein HYY31_04665 [Chloroflexi bacterium]|nr:hypothetical protein [Chloroflexota bacterium]